MVETKNDLSQKEVRDLGAANVQSTDGLSVRIWCQLSCVVFRGKTVERFIR